MTTNIGASSSAQEIIPECCMCGDSGLSHELFRCKVCHFRSQHRYCSNLYPKRESYGVCNWCLSQKKENKNLSNSSSSKKMSSKKRNNIQGRRGNSPLKPNSPIKKVKQRSPENLQKRVITNKALKEKVVRRTSSSDLENNNKNGTIMKKHVFRNKARRYKLLEEVSS